MSTQQAKQGFTLIELLVVVLIIGILAAVAVPQYQMAVAKARFSTLQSLVALYVKAGNSYFVENGSYPNTFDDMSVGIDWNTINTLTSYTCGSNADYFCCITPFSAGNYDAKITCGFSDYSVHYTFDFTDQLYFCSAKNDNTQAIRLCESITQTKTSQSSGLETPQGNLAGYLKFYLNK